MKRSVAIVGSCVSRDPFDVDAADRPAIVHYSARASFASAFSPDPFPLTLTELDPDSAVTSRWQRRMIANDLERKLPDTLRNLPAGTPVIVDLIDERFTVLAYQGHFATYSAELQKTKCHQRIPGVSLIELGTEERDDLWADGVRTFMTICEDKSLPVIVNNCLYALRNSDGSDAGDPAASEAMNHHLATMYGHLAWMNVTFLFEDDFPFVARADHRWGPAPFHYTDGIYREFNRRLDAALCAQ